MMHMIINIFGYYGSIINSIINNKFEDNHRFYSINFVWIGFMQQLNK